MIAGIHEKTPDRCQHFTEEDAYVSDRISEQVPADRAPDPLIVQQSAEIREQEPAYRKIFVTSRFVADVHKVYGEFTANDDEYPALGITLEGSPPIFMECLELPPQAIVRRRMTDEIRGDNPELLSMFDRVLERYDGRCRYSSVHIHPMDLPRPSFMDIANYEQVRLNGPFNTLEGDRPFPFILVNLHNGSLQILGSWVYRGECNAGEVIHVSETDPIVTESFRRAKPLPYFSDEAKLIRRIQRRVSDKWVISLGCRKRDMTKAILVTGKSGDRFVLGFDRTGFFGLRNPLLDSGEVHFEDHIDWEGLFSDYAAALKTPVKGVSFEIEMTSVNAQKGLTVSGSLCEPEPETAIVNRSEYPSDDPPLPNHMQSAPPPAPAPGQEAQLTEESAVAK